MYTDFYQDYSEALFGSRPFDLWFLFSLQLFNDLKIIRKWSTVEKDGGFSQLFVITFKLPPKSSVISKNDFKKKSFGSEIAEDWLWKFCEVRVAFEGKGNKLCIKGLFLVDYSPTIGLPKAALPHRSQLTSGPFFHIPTGALGALGAVPQALVNGLLNI